MKLIIFPRVLTLNNLWSCGAPSIPVLRDNKVFLLPFGAQFSHVSPIWDSLFVASDGASARIPYHTGMARAEIRLSNFRAEVR